MAFKRVTVYRCACTPDKNRFFRVSQRDYTRINVNTVLLGVERLKQPESRYIRETVFDTELHTLWACEQPYKAL